MYIRTLLSNRTNQLSIQLFRYTFVGGVATVADIGVLFLLTEYLELYYQWSAVFGFLVGLFVNYSMSIVWVFNTDTGKRNMWIDFLCFAAIGIVGLFLNAAIIYACTEQLGVYYLISKLISTILVFLWNFFGRRVLLSNTINVCRKKH